MKNYNPFISLTKTSSSFDPHYGYGSVELREVLVGLSVFGKRGVSWSAGAGKRSAVLPLLLLLRPLLLLLP